MKFKKISLLILGGCLALSLFFIFFFDFNMTGNIIKENNTISFFNETTNETENLTCIILKDGRTACLIAQNVSVSSGMLENKIYNLG